MRTETINVFNFSELSPEAQQRAIERYREQNDEIAWQAEIFDSLKALLKAANIPLVDWRLGLHSYSYIKINIDSDVAALSGARAIGWLENNLLSKLRITRAEYLKHRKDYFKYGREYRIGCIKPGPFTGICFDEAYIDDLLSNVKDGMSLGDTFKSLSNTYVRLLEAEYEDQNSDEYISDYLNCNAYEFTEDGTLY